MCPSWSKGCVKVVIRARPERCAVLAEVMGQKWTSTVCGREMGVVWRRGLY